MVYVPTMTAMMRALIPILLLPALLSAGPVIEVWPEGRIPGEFTTEPEATVPRDDGFTRITNVSRPTITLFPATRTDGKPAPAVIICPGGGYQYTVVDKEGAEIATWLNAAGITALVLKYRTPKNREGALQDAQRALRLVRSRAVEWSIDPHRIGMMGFSAGGHVTARASTTFDKPAYAAIDEIDQENPRPDFTLLIYPAYLDDGRGGLSPDLSLNDALPPTLIVHTEDDTRHVTGSYIFHKALEEANVSHQFKLYPTGGHGYGLHCEGDARVWPEDALRWLKELLK